MLVLTRKVQEAIIVNNEIHIKILGIQDGQVKIGITAPNNIDIYRQEIYDKLQSTITQTQALP